MCFILWNSFGMSICIYLSEAIRVEKERLPDLRDGHSRECDFEKWEKTGVILLREKIERRFGGLMGRNSGAPDFSIRYPTKSIFITFSNDFVVDSSRFPKTEPKR